MNKYNGILGHDFIFDVNAIYTTSGDRIIIILFPENLYGFGFKK